MFERGYQRQRLLLAERAEWDVELPGKLRREIICRGAVTNHYQPHKLCSILCEYGCEYDAEADDQIAPSIAARTRPATVDSPRSSEARRIAAVSNAFCPFSASGAGRSR